MCFLVQKDATQQAHFLCMQPLLCGRRVLSASRLSLHQRGRWMTQ